MSKARLVKASRETSTLVLSYSDGTAMEFEPVLESHNARMKAIDKAVEAIKARVDP